MKLPRPLLLLALASIAPAFAQRGDAPDTKLQPAEQQRAQFHVPPGFEVQLVASEPDIQKPLNVAFDAAGRVWVTGSTLYPWPARRDALGQPIASFEKNWDDNGLAFRAASTPPEPAEHGIDSVRVLSDFDPTTGRARKVTVFADGLNIPVGVLPLPRRSAAKAGVAADDPRGDTALVFSIPAIWRLTDTDGDGRADKREKLYDGFGFKDTHGMSSSYWQWYDGWVYGTHGFANASEVRDRAGNVTKLLSGCTYRFRPDGSKFEIHVNGQTNPFGLAFDERGDIYTADSHSKPVYLLIPGGYYEGIGAGREHDGLGYAPPITTDDHGSSAIAGIAHYSAAAFPGEFRDNLFNGNPVTRRINRTRLEWRGSSPSATRQPDFLTCDDRAFRPVQVKLGPDGALWIADFYNPIIGHYEVPLTHPARDRTHGRLWRVVWRGLDGSVTAPRLPDLTRENAGALVGRLSQPNLVARTLAANELLARDPDASALTALRTALDRLIAGTPSSSDESAALGLMFTLERAGKLDEQQLRRALARSGSEVALAALRILANGRPLPKDAEPLLGKIVATSPGAAAPGHTWRALAEVLRRHPTAGPWAGPRLLEMIERTPAADFELLYALRLALKTHALTADAATLRAWAGSTSAVAERVADVCVAVPTPAAAEFLLHHLAQTKFAGTRAGEFARHAVLQLPSDRFSEISPLLNSLAQAPAAQRLTLAEGLAQVAAKPDRRLPAEADRWMRRELVTSAADRNAALALRAINALKPLSIPEKAEPLRQVALDARAREPNRTAAVRALDPDAPETEAVLIRVLESNGPHPLRRATADLLGTPKAGAAARAALAAAFPTASADLALNLANGLAKSDAGAAELLDLVAAGRVRASLLRHRYLALSFEKRPAALRERAAALTRSLPAEDARLDALIAQRVGAAANAKTDPAHGAALFTAHCAACHKFRDAGGTLGPSLDGIGSRSLQRIIEDILDPSRNVDPAFRLTTVTLRNGETKSGMNQREQGERVLLTDPANGQDIVIARADVSEIAPSPASPMPAAFESVLKEQEFFDLVEYLRSAAGR